MRARTVAVGLVLLAMVTAGVALAQQEARPSGLRARGVFVEYDAEARTISMRERGRPQVYALLKEEAGETEVIIESESARVSDLAEGAPVIVSWRRDPETRGGRIATRIEVPTIPKSFREDLR